MSLPSQGSDVADMLVTIFSGQACGAFTYGRKCETDGCETIVVFARPGKCLRRFCPACLRARRSKRATEHNRKHRNKQP